MSKTIGWVTPVVKGSLRKTLKPFWGLVILLMKIVRWFRSILEALIRKFSASELPVNGVDETASGVQKGRIEERPGGMSVYAYFVRWRREERKKQHPNDDIAYVDFARECVEYWKNMSESEKQRFHLMAAEDKRRQEFDYDDHEEEDESDESFEQMTSQSSGNVDAGSSSDDGYTGTRRFVN